MENRYSLEEESSGNNILESFLGDTISIITVEEMSGVNTEAETGALELVALGDTGNGLISLNDSAIVILSDGSQALITRQDSNISNCGLVEISDYQPESDEVEMKDKELNEDMRDDEEMEMKLEVDDVGEIQQTEEENSNEPNFILLEDGTVACLKPQKQEDANISNCGLVEISDYQPESDEMEIKVSELNEDVRDDEEVELKLEVDEEGEIQQTEEGNSNGAKFIAFKDGTVIYLQPHQQQGLSEGVQSDDGSVYFSLGLKKVSQPSKKEKSIPCSHANCGRIYTTLHHLKVHERSHTGSRPYSCPHEGCNKAFATDYSRKAHIRTHTGEKPYKCPTTACHKSFKTSGDLQKHIRTHTGERPFQCPILGCERSFTTSNICKVHVRSHTGERPYTCNVCGRSFASATNYKNHLRIHSGEKPYVCSHENCGRRFTEYSSLYKHSLVHSEEKPYQCCVCGRKYRQASTLAVHKRAAHNIIRADDGTEILLDHMITFKVEPQVETFSDSKQHDIQEDISSNVIIHSIVSS